MDIMDILKNMDKDTLEKGLKEATKFLSTPEGQNAAKMISEGKMPEGTEMPAELKAAAESVKDNKAAQNMLGEFLKKMEAKQ